MITTPMAIASGTLLATSVLPVDNDLLKWVFGILIGEEVQGSFKQELLC
jgi:hypothetical protein